MENKELKTLKDMKPKLMMYGNKEAICYELKAEAVKWIKADIKAFEEKEIGDMENPRTKARIMLYNCLNKDCGTTLARSYPQERLK